MSDEEMKKFEDALEQLLKKQFGTKWDFKWDSHSDGGFDLELHVYTNGVREVNDEQ